MGACAPVNNAMNKFTSLEREYWQLFEIGLLVLACGLLATPVDLVPELLSRVLAQVRDRLFAAGAIIGKPDGVVVLIEHDWGLRLEMNRAGVAVLVRRLPERREGSDTYCRLLG